MGVPHPRLRLLGALLVATGLLGLVDLGRSFAHAWSVRARWEPVEGTLLAASLNQSEEWRPLGRRSTRIRPEVFYAFDFDGVEREGDTLLALDPLCFDTLILRAAQVRALPEVPAPVRVLVDPAQPTRSVLTAGLDPWFLAAWSGLLLSVVGLGLASWVAAGGRQTGFAPCIASASTGLFLLFLGAYGARSAALGGSCAALVVAGCAAGVAAAWRGRGSARALRRACSRVPLDP